MSNPSLTSQIAAILQGTGYSVQEILAGLSNPDPMVRLQIVQEIGLDKATQIINLEQQAAAQPASPPTPSTSQSVVKTLGSILGIASLVLSKLLSKFSIPGLGAGLSLSVGALLSIVGIGLSAYNVYDSLSDLFNHFTLGNFGKFLMAGASLFASAIGFFMSTGLPFMVALGPAGWLTLGIIAFVALLAAIFGRRSADAAEKPLQDIPTIWSKGPVMAITAGMVLMGTGINLAPTAPFMQQIPVPEVTLNYMLASATPMPGSNGVATSPYNGIFVDQTGDVSRIIIVTPGSNGYGNLTMYTVTDGIQVAAPTDPKSGYINIFTTDAKGNQILNPDAVQAMRGEAALAQSAQASPHNAASTVQAAAAANKYGMIH